MRGPENPMRIPLLLQTDYQEVVCYIKNKPKSVMSSGCGATCASIIGEYTTGRKDLTPEVLFRWAYENGDYFGDGLGHQAISRMMAQYGLQTEWMRPNPESIFSSLKEGKPIIAHMGSGTFAESGGHYIVIYGFDETEKQVLIHDPYKPERGDEAYDVDELIKEMKSEGIMLVQGKLDPTPAPTGQKA